jgi:hypothetical protein
MVVDFSSRTSLRNGTARMRCRTETKRKLFIFAKRRRLVVWFTIEKIIIYWVILYTRGIIQKDWHQCHLSSIRRIFNYSFSSCGSAWIVLFF